MKFPATLAVLLENFFTQRLMNQRQASPHTISSYRDTFRLLLQFAQKRLHKPPARLAFRGCRHKPRKFYNASDISLLNRYTNVNLARNSGTDSAPNRCSVWCAEYCDVRGIAG